MARKQTSSLQTRSNLLGTRRVNVKRDESTRLRVRGLLRDVLLRGLLMYLVLTGLMLAGREVFSSVAEGEIFHLNAVNLDGLNRLSRDSVLAVAGIHEGMNVFDLDLLQARRKLEDQDWIKSATLNRVLPDGLRIQIEERVPAGLVVLDELPYLVDASGEPFVVASQTEREQWPELTGLTKTDFEQYENGCTLVRQALEMASNYLDHRMGRTAALNQVHYRHGTFNLVIGQAPTTVYLGHGPLGRKLDRLAKLWAHLTKDKMKAKAIHLDNRKNPERVAVELWSAPDNEIDEIVSDLDDEYMNI